MLILFHLMINGSFAFQSILSRYNLTLQTYPIVTVDGYILRLHRVITDDYFQSTPHNYSQSRKPIILQHGLFGASNNFFINSQESDYPIKNLTNTTCAKLNNIGICLLKTQRYDVWLPNSRGNFYSNAHLHLSNELSSFWKFNSDHMSAYDLPPTIEFIQNQTKHKQIAYIGYSQGASLMFQLLSSRPEYSKTINPFIAWAPPIYISHMTSMMRYLDTTIPFFQTTAGRFVPMEYLSNYIGSLVCDFSSHTNALCGRVLTSIAGPTNHLNQTRVPNYFQYFPSIASTWSVVQFGQWYRTNRFAYFDYGLIENYHKYGQYSVPEYRLENIPQDYNITIFHGSTDGFVSEKDTRKLIDQLLSYRINVTEYRIPSDTWNHLDFLFGIDAGRLVYEPTIQMLDRFLNH